MAIIETKKLPTLKEVIVKTNNGTDHYYGEDAERVSDKIYEANMDRMIMTFPIWLDDDASEVQYTLVNIIQVLKKYRMPDIDDE